MKNLKLAIVILTAVIFQTRAAAQKDIIISDFREEKNSIEANIAGNIYYDGNERKCALIKLETTQTGFSFNFGVSAKVEHAEQKVAELWVWVGPGAKFITISHPKYGKSDRFTFPAPLESARTYTLKLITPEEVKAAPVEEKVNQQYLVFDIKPKNAALFVNEEFWPLDDGIASRYVDFGEYSWRVELDEYHTEAGTTLVQDPDKAVEVNLDLRPAFGFLSVTYNADLQDATIYLDNTAIGQAPIDRLHLRSGEHTLFIAKRYYDNYVAKILIEDGQHLIHTPQLLSNTALTTLMVEGDADILVNNVVVGKGEWRGLLEPGKYRLEAKKEFYKSRDLVRTIVKGATDTIHLPAPVPMFTSMRIETKPLKAKVNLDGKDIGTTPVSIKEIQFGRHVMTFTLPGYETVVDSLVINESKPLNYSRELTLYTGRAPQPAKPPQNVYQPAAATPAQVKPSTAPAQSAAPAKTQKKGKMKREVLKKYSLYLEGQGTYLAGDIRFAGGAIGTNLAAFNLEGLCSYGLLTTKEIYWYNSSGTSYQPEYSVMYRPYVLGARMGLQARLGRLMTFTPQAGINYTMLVGPGWKGSGHGANCLSFVGGARIFIAFAPFIGISINPEYSYGLKESEMYRLISDADPTLNDFKTGFSASAGLVLFF